MSTNWVAPLFGDVVNILTQQTVTYAPESGPVQTDLVSRGETLQSSSSQ